MQDLNSNLEIDPSSAVRHFWYFFCNNLVGVCHNSAVIALFFSLSSEATDPLVLKTHHLKNGQSILTEIAPIQAALNWWIPPLRYQAKTHLLRLF